MQLNLDVSLLVDQIVDYACTRNEGGQYCAVAQINAAADVCALLMVRNHYQLIIMSTWLPVLPLCSLRLLPCAHWVQFRVLHVPTCVM